MRAAIFAVVLILAASVLVARDDKLSIGVRSLKSAAEHENMYWRVVKYRDGVYCASAWRGGALGSEVGYRENCAGTPDSAAFGLAERLGNSGEVLFGTSYARQMASYGPGGLEDKVH